MDAISDLEALRPSDPGRDDRKTARVYAERAKILHDAHVVKGYREGLALLRNNELLQDTPGAEEARRRYKDPTHAPVIMLDGKPHREKRKHVSTLFSPRYLHERYLPLMKKTADMLVGDLERAGTMQVDEASWEMAVNMVGDIIGITRGKSREQIRKTAARIERVLYATNVNQLKGLRRQVAALRSKMYAVEFLLRDVRPTIRDRRRNAQDDLVSQLIGHGYSEEAILIDCMTYCGAGMQTTKEFISLVIWHLLDREELKQAYLNANEDTQFKILWEILRIDPIASHVYRKVPQGGLPRAGELGLEPGRSYAVNLRQANLDPQRVGECPLALDPSRADRLQEQGAYLSFGNGMHRCPGSQLALAETRVFADRLLRLPGIKLASTPHVGYVQHLSTIEIKNVTVTYDRR